MSYLGPKAIGDFADSSLVTLTGTQTLTNKTVSSLGVTGNATFDDNSKAIFGAGSDLQIYHDGLNSYIDDQGTGRIYIRASDQLRLQASDGGNYALFAANGAAQFYYANSEKLATTSTGVDVTGTVTAQALDLATNNPRIRFDDSDTSNNGEITLDNTAFRIEADEDNAVASSTIQLRVDGDTKVTVDASGNLDATGNITLDSTDAKIDLKSGATGTTGALRWMFNSTSVPYADLSLPYDTRATVGLLLRSNNGYPITIDGGNGVIFKEDSTTETMRITTSGLEVTGHVEAKGVEETVYSLGTTSGTITPNFTNGAIQKITLNGNLTFSAFTSPVAGQSITLIIDTNGTGRTLTSTMKFAGGTKTMSTTDTIDVMTVLYDGTNYLANYVTDFS